MLQIVGSFRTEGCFFFAKGTNYSSVIKRTLDLAVLISAHLLLLPLWIALWTIIPLCILVDSGRPIFYRAKRVGKDGEPFEALKFRTMVQDADEKGPPLTVPGDSRITRFGRFLRRSGLDELPQVISILKGEMSFVGPRAYNVRSHQLYVELDARFERRLTVTPGLTGLAVLYGDTADPRNRLAWDLLYIQSKSLWLDIWLIFASAFRVIRLGLERKQEIDSLPSSTIFADFPKSSIHAIDNPSEDSLPEPEDQLDPKTVTFPCVEM